MVLPSKKILYTGIASAIAIGSISFAYLYKPKTNQAAVPRTLASITTGTLVDAEQYNNDSDNDGLKDWEETLWGTDAHNSDTDDDGEPDGWEVKAGRNPIIKGPNDKIGTATSIELGTQQSALTATAAKTPDEQTATQKFSQDLFAKYMSMKQSGLEITPEIEQQLIEDFILRSGISASTNTTYLQTDFRINSDTSAASARSYGNTMGEIIKSDTPKSSVSELEIVSQAVESGDEKALARLDIILTGYKKMLLDISVVRVPADIAEVHAEFATELSSYITSITNMKKIFTDPVLSLSALDAYTKTSDDIDTTFAKIRIYFVKKGITFGQNDGGYIFINTNR